MYFVVDFVHGTWAGEFCIKLINYKIVLLNTKMISLYKFIRRVVMLLEIWKSSEFDALCRTCHHFVLLLEFWNN